MSKARLGWVLFVSGGISADVWRNRRHDDSTLSQATRETFHTDTRVGAVTFLALWTALSVWFPIHLLRKDKR